jgi:ribosome maturation factor RimP
LSLDLQRLKSLVQEIADREGCVVYDLEFGGAGGRVLRVYIDKPGAQVSIDDCSNVSKALNLRLDVEDVIPGGAYTLEVSSPGLERALREPWHFQAALGQKVWVKSKNSMVPGPMVRKQAMGELKSATEAEITVAVDNLELKIPYANIDKAKVVFEPKKNTKR